MAKKETKAAPQGTTPAAPATATAPAAPKERGTNDVFTRVFDKDGKALPPTGKLPPQAQCIMNTIEAAGAKGVTRAQLVTNLTGVLVTRQPVGRIITYYQKDLVASGAVKMTPVADAAPAAK